MKKYISYLLLALYIGSLSSCLKDTAVISPAGTHNVVEFGNVSNIASSVSNPIRLYLKTFPVVPLDTVAVTINYAGAYMAPKDIHVTIANELGVMSQFNKNEYGDDDDSYIESVPSNLIDFPTEVVIPKGKNSVHFDLIVKPDQFDFTGNYGLPLKITDADDEIISGNFGEIVIKLSLENTVTATEKVSNR